MFLWAHKCYVVVALQGDHSKMIYTIKQTALLGAFAIAMASTSVAATITYTTNGAGTGFNGGTPNVISSASGQSATLTYVDNGSDTVNVPSNGNFGTFTLRCATCSTQAMGTGATFSGFTFNIMITDVTDNASGLFVGTSTGGTIYNDSSSIDIYWAPLQLGPGTSGATTGSFGDTLFQITNQTRIVDPNSGTVPGQTTVQGNLASTTPEPATFGLLGTALLGFGMIVRRKRTC